MLRAIVDRREFEPLYKRYVDFVFRMCHRSVLDRVAAQDLTQEILLKAMCNLHTFRGGSFRAWLATIARNHLRDHARKRKSEVALTEWDVDRRPGPHEQALFNVNCQILRDALHNLDPFAQEVFELRLDGFTHIEIAEILGCSADAVRKAHSRSKQRLKGLLGIAYGEEGLE